MNGKSSIFFNVPQTGRAWWRCVWDVVRYGIANRLWKRFDLVRCPKLSKWDSTDPCERYKHCVFSLIVEFVEKEDCFGTVKFSEKEEKIIRGAYEFWKHRLPKLEKLHEMSLEHGYGNWTRMSERSTNRRKKSRKICEKVSDIISKETTQHLVNVATIWETLWT